jgi:hypothetical protein
LLLSVPISLEGALSTEIGVVTVPSTSTMSFTTRSSFPQQPSEGDTESPTSSYDGTFSLVDECETIQASSPPKKRRVSTVQSGWQTFCSKGTRFKTLLDDALVKLSDDAVPLASERKDAVGTASNDITSSNSYPSTVATVARQKTTECIMLQQQLEKVKSEHVQAIALNNDLREGAKQQAARLQKMTTALNLASQNTAKARTEVDEAEAAAITLESHLEALQVVVQETKRASQLLLREHEEITQRAQTMEQKYVQAQADLVRSNSQRQKLQRDDEELIQSKRSLEIQIHDLKTHMDVEEMEGKRWEQSCSELQQSEKMSQARIERLEEDLQCSSNLLVEATATAAETESTSTELKHSLEKMQQNIESLHKELETKQKNERDFKDRSQKMFVKSQRENQTLKSQAESELEKIKKLTSEKQAQEKRIGQLQAKTSNMERRLQESTNIVNTGNASDFHIPPLHGKENPHPLPTCKCTICFKTLTTGLMKKCQCGETGCMSRAHVSCVNKITAGPSLSYPGTPAPRLPVILCSAAKARAIAITPHEKAK